MGRTNNRGVTVQCPFNR